MEEDNHSSADDFEHVSECDRDDHPMKPTDEATEMLRNEFREEIDAIKTENKILAEKNNVLAANNREVHARLETMEQKLKVDDLETKLAREKIHDLIEVKMIDNAEEKIHELGQKMEMMKCNVEEEIGKLQKQLSDAETKQAENDKEMAQIRAELEIIIADENADDELDAYWRQQLEKEGGEEVMQEQAGDGSQHTREATLEVIRKQLDEFEGESLAEITVGPAIGGDLTHLQATIVGPRHSAYEGGLFFLDMRFPVDFPFRPPKVLFKTRIFHPNINSSGQIGLDILEAQHWSPTLTILKVLLSISSFLCDPNPEVSFYPKIAHMYKHNRYKYNAFARKWTHMYAMN